MTWYWVGDGGKGRSALLRLCMEYIAMCFYCVSAQEMCFDEKRGSGAKSLAYLTGSGNGDVSASGQAMPKR